MFPLPLLYHFLLVFAVIYFWCLRFDCQLVCIWLNKIQLCETQLRIHIDGSLIVGGCQLNSLSLLVYYLRITSRARAFYSRIKLNPLWLFLANKLKRSTDRLCIPFLEEKAGLDITHLPNERYKDKFNHIMSKDCLPVSLGGNYNNNSQFPVPGRIPTSYFFNAVSFLQSHRSCCLVTLVHCLL